MANKVDIDKIIDIIFSRKLEFTYVAILSFLITLLFSFLLPVKYTSHSVLEILESNQGPDLNSQTSFLANLGGINLGSSGIQRKKDLIKEILISKDFLENFGNKHDLFPEIFASKGFDKESKSIIYKDSLFNNKKREWKYGFPDFDEIHEEHLENLKIVEKPLTDFLIISYEHSSPVFAQKIVSIMIKELDDKLRNREIEYSNNALEFLKERLSQETMQESRNAVGKLIQNNLNKLILANIKQDHILTPIEPPRVSSEKSSPKRLFISFIIMILALITFLIYAFFKYIFSENKEE